MILILFMALYVHVYIILFLIITCLILKLPFFWGSYLASHYGVVVLISHNAIKKPPVESLLFARDQALKL